MQDESQVSSMRIVGTDGNVGRWQYQRLFATKGAVPFSFQELGLLGGWALKMLDLPWCVGTDGNVGAWNGSGWDDKGRMGGWTLKMLAFRFDGVWCIGTKGDVGVWTGTEWHEQGRIGGWTADWLS